MSTIDEKRVYGDREGATEAYVASSVGVVRVSVAADAVGEFGLFERCTARDVAAGFETVAVATDEDVLVSDGDAADGFAETDFGPAVAVGFDGGDRRDAVDAVLAADADGRVARRRDGEWLDLECEADASLDVRAIDGDLVGTNHGVFRVHDGALDHAGLEEVRDVSAAGIPLAATADGLYKLGNGWMRVLDGAFDVVAADPRTEAGRLDRAHAAAGLTIHEHADGEWREFADTSAPIVGLAYGETVYAVTERGTVLAASGDGWRSRTLGVSGVSGIAIPSGRSR